uniref:Fatty acyl-CoA reductase n=1 Tax=Triticum urartu TaxID=4572 RepID=A0A8R7QJ57_TRIUA
MDAGAVAGCLRDKTVLVTGSTGYLGKLMVEKILRVQPDVKKVYLLVRAPDAASAEQRILTQVLGKDLFNTLREKHGLAGFQKLIKEKIVPLAGDVGTRNFGLDSSTSDDLCQEIDVIVHGAATTSFYERYDVALASNALGAQYGCEFAKKCPNLKLLLHVSTAFVAGTQEGLLLEKALKMGEALRPGCHLDIEAELQLVEKVKAELAEAKSGGSDQSSEKIAMKELGFKRACHFGWPNVYTFTKAMGEMLLEQQRGDLPVVIIRPTMVTSTYQDPFPGWIEGARTIDALIVAYNEQAFPCFVGDRNDTMDAVSNT